MVLIEPPSTVVDISTVKQVSVQLKEYHMDIFI
jgi:hypothetical protein